MSVDSGEACVGAVLCLVFNVFSTLFVILSSVGVSATPLTWVSGGACVGSFVLLCCSKDVRRGLHEAD